MVESTRVLSKRVQSAAGAGATVRETPVGVDERGFMTDLSRWTPGAALYLARRQGLKGWGDELTSDHWRVIDYMRTYYEATGNAPSLRYTCRALGLTKRQFSRLFPGGLMTARRVSGLPGARRSGNGEETSIARELVTRDWWERLTGAEPEDDAGMGFGDRLLVRPTPDPPSRSGERESGRAPKRRELSPGQRAMARNWWKRLIGA